jgi:2-(1,2-epoxy-1,2-dihydrophenyl)acetyl-CoA isomerase
MISAGWGRVARELEITPRPDIILVMDDRAAVLGTYAGRSRRTGELFEAWFAHFWRVDGGRFAGLRQVTDTAAWQRVASGDETRDPQ